MLSTDAPAKVSVPFGADGSRNVIPIPSQIGITDGAASYTDGFPPLTATDPTAGGIPPDVQDMNGVLFAVSDKLQWSDAGGLPRYDGAFSMAIGGYPIGSVLQSADTTGLWISTADNNTTNPDTGGAGWVPHFFFGGATQAAAAINITLSSIQAAKPIITISGVLTANVALTFPLWVKQWLVLNKTTGAFTLSAKTSTGSPVTLQAGANLLYGDGSNILSASFLTPTNFPSVQSANGYIKFPGGLIVQWCNGAGATAEGQQTVTFPIAFPTACLSVNVSCNYPTGDSAVNATFQEVSKSATAVVLMCQNDASTWTNPVSPTVWAFGN